MNQSEAHDHLAMVDRILERAENRPFRPVASLLIVWGLAAAAMDAGEQAFIRSGVQGFERAGEIALILAAVASVFIGFAVARNADRIPTSERRLGRAVGAVWICIVAAAFAQPYVFGGWSAGGVWALGAAITMLISGFSGDRRGLAGGVVLIASLLVANYLTPHAPGYALAAGMFLGYAVPGVFIALKGAPGET